MKLPLAEEMRALDEMAIKRYGIPGVVLMENAGRATVHAMVERYGDPRGKTVPIFVGPGNNGGDGLVIARHLHQMGARPVAILLCPPENMRGDAEVHLGIVKQLPVTTFLLSEKKDLRTVKALCAGAWLAVDALFGTGLGRPLTGLFAETVHCINTLPCPVVAVDLPSGLHSDTGMPMGTAVRADLTVTYGLPKPAHYLHPGAELRGSLRVVDIGIPPEAIAARGIRQEVLVGADIAAWLPPRGPASHKGSFGHVLVAGGGIGKAGAALLAARGALRSGAGLVTLFLPERLNGIVQSALPEAMTIPFPGDAAHLGEDAYKALLTATTGKKAMVLGPGMGTAEETVRLTRRLWKTVPIPMVVDADGLNCLETSRGTLPPAPAARILTPHPGEMARLAACGTGEVQSNRLALARRYAEENKVFLVLKGAGTVVAAPDGMVAVTPTGNPAMATGGMGDVLSGAIGGLLAAGLAPWRAACLGVFLHGLAADILVRGRVYPSGILASEVADALPLACGEIASRRS